MYVDNLFSINVVLVFAIFVPIIFLLFGFWTKGHSFWNLIDFPYYTLGIVGVLSYFSADEKARHINALEAELALTRAFWNSTVSLDPKEHYDLQSLLNEANEYFSEIEQRINAECAKDSQGYSCSLKSRLMQAGYSFGVKLDEKDFQTDIFIGCEKLEQKSEKLWSQDIEVSQCLHPASEFCNGKLLNNNDSLDDNGTSISSSIKKNSPSFMHGGWGTRGLTLAQFCYDAIQHRATSSYAKARIETAEEVHALSKKTVIENPSNWSILDTPWFRALWPFVLILAAALKLGKWSASTIKSVGRKNPV